MQFHDDKFCLPAVRIAFSLLTLVVLGSAVHAQTATKINQAAKDLPPGARQRLAIKQLEQFAVYWTDEPGWHSELQLRNNLEGQSLIVTPVLRSSDGTEATLPNVTIASNDVTMVDLHEAVLKSAPQMIGAFGSIVLRYEAPVVRALYAAVMLHDAGHPIAFHLDAFPKPKEYEIGSREGIWWLPNSTATDYLILTNSGPTPISTRIELFSSDGQSSSQPVLLKSHQTVRLSLRSLVDQGHLQGTFGGFRISLHGGAKHLDTAHVIFDETTGFSAMLKMFDRDPRSTLFSRAWGGVREWTTRAPMLALTDPDPALAFPAGTKLQPHVFLRNTSKKNYDATVILHWRSSKGQGNSEPVHVSLKADQTVSIDVGGLQRQNVVPPDANWASVIISAPVMPDDFMAIASSYDETLRYGAQTPFDDQLAFHWEGGRWEMDSTHNSIIAVGNGGGKPTTAELTLIYGHGEKSYVLEQTLAPLQQMWVDVAKLIRDQLPDNNGNVLPRDLTSGTYRLRDLTDMAVGNLYEGKIVTDKSFGHAAYGCMICCGYPEGAYMGNDPFAIPTGNTRNQAVHGVDSCTGYANDITTFFSNWGTGNSSVATASNNQILGVGGGGTTDFSAGTINVGDGETLLHQCPRASTQPSGEVNVGPYQVQVLATAQEGPASCPTGSGGYRRNVTNQLQYVNGAPYAVTGLTVADTITVGSQNALGISGTLTGSATTTGDGSFPDSYGVCTPACPASAGETDAIQSWTVNWVGLPHSNLVVYKCTSIKVDGR